MSSGGNTTTFPQFAKLPPEIRCRIWRYSKPGPRLVVIKYHRNTALYRACIPPPEMLRVNGESRHEGLRIYRELRLGPYTNTSCYVDPTRDMVYLKSDIERGTDYVADPTSVHPWHRGCAVPPQRNPAAAPPAPPGSHIEQQENGEPAQLDFPDLGSRRHSKIILDDIFNSPDGEWIFRNFHTDVVTWGLIRRSYCRWRHHLPFELEKLCLVYERGDGQLRGDSPLRDIHRIVDGIQSIPSTVAGPSSEQDRTAILMVRGQYAIKSFVNREDRWRGLPPVLSYDVIAKSLERGSEPSG